MLDLIIPDWPAPRWIKAYTTTRHGGFSQAPFDSLNVSLRVGDNPACVIKNRQLLQSSLGLKQQPLWLKQVHGNTVISADHLTNTLAADAIYSKNQQTVCAVQTADCLPLLICSVSNYCIAAVHAGWKGLSNGILENAILALECPPRDLLVWLGPAIGPQAFIVGEDVVQAFISKDHATQTAFHDIGHNKWRANLYALAKQRLNKLGINTVYGGKYCTYTDPKRFFSYRRDQVTGRMLSFIWINPNP
jgi:YfiH family protein